MCWGAGLVPLPHGKLPPIPVLPALQHLAHGLSPLGDSQDKGTQEEAEQRVLPWGSAWSGIDGQSAALLEI